jgi:hypothetical protein
MAIARNSYCANPPCPAGRLVWASAQLLMSNPQIGEGVGEVKTCLAAFLGSQRVGVGGRRWAQSAPGRLQRDGAGPDRFSTSALTRAENGSSLSRGASRVGHATVRLPLRSISVSGPTEMTRPPAVCVHSHRIGRGRQTEECKYDCDNEKESRAQSGQREPA